MKNKHIALLVMVMVGMIRPLTAQNDSTYFSHIDTVVVSATKSYTQKKNIPALVSVIDSLTFEELKVSDISDLNALVPNLFMQKHGTRLTSPVYIRGIGSRINAPAVGLYVDGIPYFDMGTFNFEMFDVRKIEVLRGPQGTLYGRNTMGGLINIITAEPGPVREGYVYGAYGNYNRFKTVWHYNTPVTDKLYVMGDAAYAHSDGFFRNTYLDSPADNYDTYAGRFKLRYRPAARWDIRAVLNYEHSYDGGYPYALYDTGTQEAGEISYDQPSSYTRDLLSAGLKVHYTGNNYLFQSATSYQNLVDAQRIDQDFTTLNLLYVTQDRTHHTWVQEFTFKSLPSSKVQWVGGAFGFDNLRKKDVEVYYNEDAVTLFHLPGKMVKYKYYDIPERGAALYGQVTYPAGDFQLTAGLRADYETDLFDYKYDLALNGHVYPKEQVDTLNTYFELLPKLSVSYRFSPRVMTYAGFAKGYKAGGFNSTFERPEDISYDPEYSYNYEAGIKLSSRDNKLKVNANLFYIDWLNQQVYQPVPSGQGAMLKNAGHSMSRGAELEINWLPAKHWRTWLYAGYDEAKFLSYVKDEETDYSGNWIPYIPRYTANVGFIYYHPVESRWFDYVNLSAHYNLVGDFYWNDANTAYQKAYGLLNANISLDGDRWSVGLYGRNLLNAKYNAFYFEALGHSYVQPGAPMQISGFVKIKF